jgi:hypothetical protein
MEPVAARLAALGSPGRLPNLEWTTLAHVLKLLGRTAPEQVPKEELRKMFKRSLRQIESSIDESTLELLKRFGKPAP